MEEVEKFFKCPYCLEKISMLLDVSEEGAQTYVEDCEVCCNPIQLTYEGYQRQSQKLHHRQSLRLTIL